MAEYNETPEKRITTTHDRFTVDCSQCGFLPYGYTNFTDALNYAKKAVLKHASPNEKITVFDRMAHKGKPELWDYQGNIISHKP